MFLKILCALTNNNISNIHDRESESYQNYFKKYMNTECIQVPLKDTPVRFPVC